MIEPRAREIVPNEYEVFQRNRRTLADLAVRLGRALERLGLESQSKAMTVLREKLDSDVFKVMVLGEFKRGKSTFINALLGETVLPADAVPCTAVISEIRWSERRKVVVNFRHPAPSPLPADLPPEVLAHLRKVGGRPAAPLEVSVEALWKYAAIADPAKDAEESVAATPYSRIEISWPIELCRQGVEIIDSPGLNENRTRAEVSKNYLSSVDAVLFVIACTAPISDSEIRVIENDLRGSGHQELFFVCNRFDQIHESQRPRLVSYIQEKLRRYTDFGEGGIFFLSAWNALNAALEGDEAELEKSGLPGLEKALTRFLTQDRGRVKLLQPAREILHAVDKAQASQIPEQRRMLESDLESLEAKYEAVKPRLAAAERTQRQIAANIELQARSLRSEVRMETERFLNRTASSLRKWISELNLDQRIGFISMLKEGQIEALAKEVCQKVSVRFETEASRWKESTLKPLVAERQRSLEAQVAAQVAEFSAHIEQTLDGTVWERAGGLKKRETVRWFGDSGLDMEVARRLGAFGALFAAIRLRDPRSLIKAVLAALLEVLRLQPGGLQERAKEAIADVLAERLRKDTEEAATSIADEVHERTLAYGKSVSDALERETRGIREQTEAVLRDKREGEVKVQARKRALMEVEAEVRDIDAAVKEMVLALAGR